MPRGTAANLALGPGYLYIAPIGTTEPTDLATAWASVSAAWAALGYTEDGSQFNYQLNTDQVTVAETLDPIQNTPTGRTMSVEFILAEITATNLKRAFNGGTITSGTGCVYFEPPDLGTEVRAMIGFESEDHTERWLYRQCFNNGQIQMPRRKGNANATIPVTFLLEAPATGLRPFRAIMGAPARQ
jgi:hypothetical protein